MGQSLVKNHMHIIFSTKHRKHWIDQSVESRLHSYLGAICNKMDCQVIKVGGYTDHVHILCMLSKNIALCKLVQEIKSNSSRWMKTIGEPYRDFHWQNGYSGFSVYPNESDRVVEYITNQHIHHRKQSFQEEYREFLNKYKVEYDERYIWD